MSHYDKQLEDLAIWQDHKSEVHLEEVYDEVEKPKHYNSYPGIEVIQLTEHLNFCRGNVVKYVARAAFKGSELQDLEKALWYLQREIARLKS